MLLLKAVTVVVAGVLTSLAVKHLLTEMEAAKARVRAQKPREQGVTRLRQDPRTGIYYPEN